ncbi:MAG: bifunctional glutamate N-acetyltransferase/amino-acid acetyltransferase ArgJ [Myxococcales bacterium]
MKTPQGFTFAGVHAGIKPSRKDVALVYSDTPCAAAGCLTVNKARASHILDASDRLPAEGVRAVVINSGNANALTGQAGLDGIRGVMKEVAQALQVTPEAVLAASTGVIGVPFPAHKVVDAVPRLVRALREEPDGAAEAIMTTDTRIKLASRSLQLGGKEITLSAICKGSGMMAPQLATVLAVITTDCDIRSGPLAHALRAAMADSFHCLTVDGDMSTNDTVYALANGRAGNRPIKGAGKDLEHFSAALSDLCQDLARQIASDGEGATKLLTVTVTGAPTAVIARDLARSIAGSSLVKAAVFGADPNWGRVLATVGARAGSEDYPIDPYAAKVSIQNVVTFDGGAPLPYDAAILKSKMRTPEVSIDVELVEGDARAVAWGCDLSYDYVKINADYTSLIVQTPSGGVAKDDRLTNYSPQFKVSLLVEALSYISRLEGKRCVIKYGGAAMVKDSLKKAFADDVNLLRSVGLIPIVVHGGGPEISRTLEKLGSRSEFVDGVRVTDKDDAKLVEMVLTGSINSEIVTLLNGKGGHAIGLSGKDGALLRAKKLLGEGGRDLGHVGEVTHVNRDLLEMLLRQNYVPVISPVGMGDDGNGYAISGDSVAAEIAIAVGASKLIYLTDVSGILDNGEVVSEMKSAELERQLEGGGISGNMRTRARAILRALSSGVERVHVIDGHTPHNVIAELFTDRGVGTLVTP